MLALYRFATAAVSPLVPAYLERRRRRGKEDAQRLPERFGNASLPRPQGKLLWVHAASVGEAQSALTLLSKIQARFPGWRMLVTTGTVTSAALMRERLPEGVLHQYVPVDTPQAVDAFLAHWQPDTAFWIESELWPNLVTRASKTGVRMALVNARISEKSFRAWKRLQGMISGLLGCFEAVYAQSEADAERFRLLSRAPAGVQCLGNLKYDAPVLPFDAQALAALQGQVGRRPCWLAASIHPGEDALVAQAHTQMRGDVAQLLTLVVPRHPAKAEAMRMLFEQAGLKVAARSRGESVLPDTDIYLADTMGELGLFYRLHTAVFIGGSLVAHGGQNPLEPARLRNAVLFGPHMFNFAEIAQELLRHDAAIAVRDAETLAKQVRHLLERRDVLADYSTRACAWAEAQTGSAERLLDALSPLLAE